MKWIIDERDGMLALGFEGDPDFIRKSFNFCVNMGVVDRGRLHQDLETFAFVYTTETKIKRGLFKERYYQGLINREGGVQACLNAKRYVKDEWAKISREKFLFETQFYS